TAALPAAPSLRHTRGGGAGPPGSDALILDLDASHEGVTRDDQLLAAIVWPARHVFEGAQQGRSARLHHPVRGHLELDPAPEGEGVDDGLARLDRGLAEVDLATAHHRPGVATAEVGSAQGTLHAAHEGGDVEVLARVDRRYRSGGRRTSRGAPDDRGAHGEQEQSEGQTKLEDAEIDEEEDEAEHDQEVAPRASSRPQAMRELREAHGDQQDGPESDESAAMKQAEVVEGEQQPDRHHGQPQDEPQRDLGGCPSVPHPTLLSVDHTAGGAGRTQSIRRSGRWLKPSRTTSSSDSATKNRSAIQVGPIFSFAISVLLSPEHTQREAPCQG